MNRVTRTILIQLAPALWIAAITLGVLRCFLTGEFDQMASVIVLLAVMAATGTVGGIVEDKRDAEVERLGRKLADATRGRLVPAARERQPLRRVL